MARAAKRRSLSEKDVPGRGKARKSAGILKRKQAAQRRAGAKAQSAMDRALGIQRRNQFPEG